MGNDFTGSGGGLLLADLNDVTFPNELAETNNFTGTGTGVGVQNSDGITISDLVIEGVEKTYLVLSGVTNSTVSGIVSNTATTGIMVNGGGGNTISNIDVSWDGPGLTGTGIALNTTSGNTLTEVTVNNRMYGVHLYQAPDNRISCGTMSGSSYAFYVQSNSGNTSVNLNSIAGNLYYGINNETGLPLNAESNYWGSPDGPNGAGDAISANVDADPFVSDPEELNAACGRFVMVGIDVKPGGDANSINMRAKGVVSVAILTTSVADGESLDFDAVSVDQATVTFAGASPRGKGKSGNIGSLEDVDGDGDLDLVLQFPIPDLALTPGDSVAELEGQTLEGTPIRGSDSVTVR